MQEPFTEFRGTPLWRAVASSIADLEASREVSLAMAKDYVIGYICRELAAKRVVETAALTPDR